MFSQDGKPTWDRSRGRNANKSRGPRRVCSPTLEAHGLSSVGQVSAIQVCPLSGCPRGWRLCLRPQYSPSDVGAGDKRSLRGPGLFLEGPSLLTLPRIPACWVGYENAGLTGACGHRQPPLGASVTPCRPRRCRCQDSTDKTLLPGSCQSREQTEREFISRNENGGPGGNSRSPSQEGSPRIPDALFGLRAPWGPPLSHPSCWVAWCVIGCPLRCFWSPLKGWGPCPFCPVYLPSL